MPKISHHLLDKFEETAFSLFFEGNLPGLAAQLQSISLDQTQSPPPRIALFATLMQPGSNVQLENLFSRFLTEDDLEACCACIGGALAAIWDSGSRFDRFLPWLEHAEVLLQRSETIPAAARAFLLLQKAFAEMAGPGDLTKAKQSYRLQKQAAEEAGSVSLLVIGTAAHAYCSTWSGNLAKGELLLLDTAPFLTDPQLNPVCLVQHQNTLAVIKTIQGEWQQATDILQQLLAHPLFPQLPPMLQLQTLNILVETHVVANNSIEAEKTANRARALAVPENNNFFRSYLNFCLGISALLEKRPSKALNYSDEAIERSELAGSAVAIRMNALLRGQALADLGREQEALEHLETWHSRWKESGYTLIAALGKLEEAAIYLRQGSADQAREQWLAAHQLIPVGEKMFHLYRPESFYRALEQRLLHGSKTNFQECHHPVRIKTLGEFYLEINGQRLYDRDWKGRQTKDLLKALIVYGGQKVDLNEISALLWPDTDGDLAINSLNVALSRLRKIGTRSGLQSIPWVVSRHRKLSLVGSLCCIDALIFRDKMKAALQSPTDMAQLQRGLDLYTGNFLPNTSGLGTIETFRKELLHLYIKGVLRRAESLADETDFHAMIALFEQALNYDPLNEILYWELMHTHLKQNNRGKALETYDRAVNSLATGLDIEPGSALQALAEKARNQ